KTCGFPRELPGGDGAVEVVLLPWCGGAMGVPLLESRFRPRSSTMTAKKKSVRATPAPRTKNKTPALPTPEPAATAPAKKYSALDAAAQVLRESGQPMSCPEL